ncbi:MAG: metabolite traffic protein EboE [Fuerstiella sp.]
MSFSSLPLSYCTNVHPGKTVDEVINGLSEYTAEVRRQLDAPMAAGLWLCRSVVSELLKDDASLERLAQTLWQHDLCCYTLNAFPFGDFHSERVKEQVYLPDWTSIKRLKYTKDCARLLAQMLPEGSEGSISTVPLGGRMNPTTPDFQAICFRNLILLAKWLKELHESTGRLIRLAIEPEPLCEMSSIPGDAVPLFRSLFEMAEALGDLPCVQEHIGLCFDVCHQAIVFEDVTTSINLIVSSDIRINKVHITNAIELQNPSENAAGREALVSYVEPRYLHQTFARMSDGSVVNRLDLTADDIRREPSDSFLQAETWRVHFHVPVYADELGPLKTTRPDLKAALQTILELEYSPHLEVETYTWPVMPDSDTAASSLSSQITRELESAYDLLRELS